MSEPIEPLEIPIQIEGLEAARADLEKVAARAAQMGGDVKKAGELGRLGLWGLGESAENAAQSMGVPNQAARQLGNAVEGLASKLGMASIAMGGMALAVIAGVGIWKQYAESQEKARTELIEHGKASANWIIGATSEHTKTKELAESKRALALAEFDLNKTRAERSIPALEAQVKTLTDSLRKATDIQQGRGTEYIRGGSLLDSLLLGSDEDRAKAVLDAKNALAEVSAQLRVTRAATKLFSPENREDIGSDAAIAGARTEAEILLAIERDTYNKKQELKWQINQDEIKDAELTKARDMQLMQTRADILTSGLDAINSLTKGKYKAIYLTMQAVAAGQAIMSGYAASAAALAPPPLGYGPVIGAGIAPTLVTLGYVKAAAIMAQAYGTMQAGRSGGGGAMPTYSANPATGQPTGGGGTININFNGQPVGEYDLARGVMRTLYNNNGSIDGLSVAIEKSI